MANKGDVGKKGAGGLVSGGTSKATKAADKAAEDTPFLGAEGKQLAQTTGGATQLTGGILRGDKDDIKEGAKTLGKGVWSAVTAAPLRSLNTPPPQQFAGGSPEALAAKRAQYESGILSGAGMVDRGESTSGYGAAVAADASRMGGDTYGRGTGLYGAGMSTAMGGMNAQTSALGGSIAAANRDVGSVAAQQQFMANDENSRRMMGLAASARGGNQAAAQRNAQAAASQNALVTNQQIGLMRLQEEQAKRAQQVQAQQFAASQYGDRAALGYGTAAQGLGAENAATGQVNTSASTIGNIGGNVMDAGNTQTKTFVDAETELNKSQLDADTKHASAKKASQGGVMGVVGKAIGGLFALTLAFVHFGAGSF